MKIIPTKCATEVTWAEVAGKVLRLQARGKVCEGMGIWIPPVQSTLNPSDPELLIIHFGCAMPFSEVVSLETLKKWVNEGSMVVTDEKFWLGLCV